MTTTENASLVDFIETQIAKCDRCIDRGQNELHRLSRMGLRYGDAGWNDHCRAARAVIEQVVGGKAERRYWFARLDTVTTR